MESSLEESLEDFLNQKEILDELNNLASKGERSLVLEFDEIVESDMELANSLLDNPSDFFEKADEILENITEIPRFHLRVKDLGKTVRRR